MKIENTFTVDASVEDAWNLLTDIPEIAPCLPGAKLTGEEDGVYSGAVKVKVGPITAEYKGTAEFVERDEVAHRAVINGKGRDSRGSGNASALITAEMKAVGDATEVSVVTDLKISGKVAQFGRGIMQDVSEKLLGQFSDCLAAKLADRSSATDASTSAVQDTVAASTGGTAPASSASTSATSTASRPSNSAASTSASSAAASSSDDALDLLDVAGGSVTKRFAPAAAGVGLALVLFLLRRGRRRRSA